MRILLLNYQIPYPLNNGANLHTFSIFQDLDKLRTDVYNVYKGGQ